MEYEYKKQVSLDSLLGVHDRHEITCPRINALQFDTECSSKIYKVELDFDPINLKLNLTELFKAMNDLDQWSAGIMDVLNKLPDNLRDEIVTEVFLMESNYKIMIEEYNNDYKAEIKEYAVEINGLIEEWIDYRNDYVEAHEEKIKQTLLLEEQEKELLFLKLNGKYLEDCMGLIEFYKDEVYEQTEKKQDAETNFERYVKGDFETKIKQFSYFLEDVRNRNDDLRCRTGEIKFQIEQKAKEILNICQPDEYLDKKFGIQPSVANLGVMFNNTETDARNEHVNFNSFVLGMRSKRFITLDQLNKLLDMKVNDSVDYRAERKSAIIDMLKANGVITVRYYNDQKEYAKDRDGYTEQQINKHLYKQKIKQN